jgi:hypothetical protein
LIATRRNWRVRLPFLLPAAAILLALLFLRVEQAARR